MNETEHKLNVLSTIAKKFNYFNSSYFHQMLKADKILPLDDYPDDGILKELGADVRDTFLDQGHYYRLSIGRSMDVIYCRRNLFEKAGRDTVNQILNGNLSSAGKEAMQNAAEQIQTLLQLGILGTNPLNENEADAETAFFSGRTAMFLNGIWQAGNIDGSSLDPDQIALIPFPGDFAGQYGEYYAGNTGGASFFVNRRTDSPAVPADFAVYLTEYLGEHVSSSDLDIPIWKKAKENASSTLHRITDFNLTADNDVSAWDLSLFPKAAGIYLEMS